MFVAVCAFLADALVHGSHYHGTHTEAALTALGAFGLSIAVSYTPIGKQMDRLAESFLHVDAVHVADLKTLQRE
jgi:hypothetical protein